MGRVRETRFKHGDLSKRPTDKQELIKAEKLWQELADNLNANNGGIQETVEGWKQIYAQLKSQGALRMTTPDDQTHSAGNHFGAPAPRRVVTDVTGHSLEAVLARQAAALKNMAGAIAAMATTLDQISEVMHRVLALGVAPQSLFENQPTIKKNQNNLIDIYYQNVRGLRTKLDMFNIGISSAISDLYAITETGFNDSIPDAEIVPPGYSIIRCDRVDGRKQGGACLVATPRLEIRHAPVLHDVNIDNHFFELVCATVYLQNRFLFLCCVVYIPPNSNKDEYMLLFTIIELYCDKYDKILVIGDFNLYSSSSNIKNYFEDFLAYCGFTQTNNVMNCNDRCLDLVLCTFGEGNSVRVRASDRPLVPVDAHHPPLEVEVRLGLCRATEPGPHIGAYTVGADIG